MNYLIKDDIISFPNLFIKNLKVDNFKRELSLKLNTPLEIIGVSDKGLIIRMLDMDEDDIRLKSEEIYDLLEEILNKYKGKTFYKTYNFLLIPTGNEILSGTISDENTPEISKLIIEKFPGSTIKKLRPLDDDEMVISNTLNSVLNENYDFIIFIGGTGGGHRYNNLFGKDLVQSAIGNKFKDNFREFYGDNGHLFSRISLHKTKNSTILNLPGPQDECIPLAKIFIDNINESEKFILDLMEKKLIEIYEEKYKKIVKLKNHEEFLQKRILHYRSLGMGARQIAKLLNSEGFNIKYYHVHYRIQKLEKK